MFWILTTYALFLIVAFWRFKAWITERRKPESVAFFHPYCNAGGGGERVLWCAVRVIQQRSPNTNFYIYSGDTDSTKEQILLKARQRFNIEIDPKRVHFVFLRLRRLVEADLYPVFTLFFQILAGGILALEAICRVNAETIVDTMGYPLSLPVFRYLGGAVTGAYVHYPVISSDMIDLVARREATYNNASVVARNAWLAGIKVHYYRVLAFLYGEMGRAANFVMANGTWTANHLCKIWKRADVKIVFPPCDVSGLLGIESCAEARLVTNSEVQILSIGQIRPEKNHRLQIDVIKQLSDRLKLAHLPIKLKLVIAGGCRHADDLRRVETLKRYSQSIGAYDLIDWRLNIPYEELLDSLSAALISIHTMWNEHFGISVVEGLAAGSIMVAHNSGGPLMDIVVPSTGDQKVGYLAETAQEYVDRIYEVITLSGAERNALRARARNQARKFSEEVFEQNWLNSHSW